MKAVATLIVLMLAAGHAHGQGCAEKEAELRRKLEVARERGGDRRIRGLETALRSVQMNCTEAGLQAERQEAIDEARDEVAEREADLQEALEDGSPEKIETRREKLREAQDELREALAE